MNAYELAKNISKDNCVILADDKKIIANMLRQQADRIAELEQFWKDCEEDRTKKCSDCQSAEPVAWMLNGILHECDPSDWAKEQYPDQDVIPLYTTPQIKELSDEEILEVWRENERVYPMDRSRLLDRTRACIKKASEK